MPILVRLVVAYIVNFICSYVPLTDGSEKIGSPKPYTPKADLGGVSGTKALGYESEKPKLESVYVSGPSWCESKSEVVSSATGIGAMELDFISSVINPPTRTAMPNSTIPASTQPAFFKYCIKISIKNRTPLLYRVVSAAELFFVGAPVYRPGVALHARDDAERQKLGDEVRAAVAHKRDRGARHGQHA